MSSFDPLAFVPTPARAIDVYERKDRGDLVNLANNELVHPELAPILAAALEAAGPEDARAYPLVADVRRGLAALIGVELDQVALSAGADLLLGAVTRALLLQASSVAIQHPCYGSDHLRLHGITPVRIGFEGEGFDRAALESFVETRHGGAVWLSNPNSPTGATWPLHEVAELARQCARRGHLLLVDETYAPFAAFDHLDLVRGQANVLVVRSLSKVWGAAGLRLAFAAGPPAWITHLRRWNTENPLSGPSLAAARVLLDRAPELARIGADVAAQREWFAAEICRLRPEWSVLPGGGNFVVVRVGSSGGGTLKGLHAAGIAARDLGGIGVGALRGCMRIALADRGTLERVVAVLGSLNQRVRSSPTRARR